MSLVDDLILQDIFHGWFPAREVLEKFKGSDSTRKKHLAANRAKVQEMLSRIEEHVDAATAEKIFLAGMLWEGSLWAADGISGQSQTKPANQGNVEKGERNKKLIIAKFWEIHQQNLDDKLVRNKGAIVRKLAALKIVSERRIWDYLEGIDLETTSPPARRKRKL